MNNSQNRRIPIARCPNPECRCTILYSNNAKEKNMVEVSIAEPGYQGPTILCAKCKTMLKFSKKERIK